MKDLLSIIAEGTMRAAVRMINETERFPRCKALQDMGDYTTTTKALQDSLKMHLDGYRKEWADAVEARMPESMLRVIVNAQCNQVALDALNIVENQIRYKEE